MNSIPYEFHPVHQFRNIINSKIKELSPPIKQEGNTIQNNSASVKFHGTQTQFVELVKALITNGNIKGVQKDIFQILSQVFDIQLNNHEKTISDIANRNNGSETLFLNELQKSLTSHIQLKSENKKNRR